MKRLGHCPRCGQWVEQQPKQVLLEEHQDGDEACPVKMPDRMKNVLESSDEARRTAILILNDQGGCLEQPGHHHSSSCSCEVVRQIQSTSLAEWVIKNLPRPECPACHNPVEDYEIKSWFVSGPPPTRAFRCQYCNTLIWEYTLPNGSPVLLNQADKPAGMPLGEWIAERLTAEVSKRN